MSQNTSVSSKVNIPLIVLWIVSIVAVVGGYLLVISSNASQADLYAAGTADYPGLFAAQSGAAIGTAIIGAGVIGFLIALALHAHFFAVKQAAASVADVIIDADDDIDEIDIVEVAPVTPTAHAASTPKATTLEAPTSAPTTDVTPDINPDGTTKN
ncbi:hypothetical protein [Leifsonia sp. A12D58]|uniref:hypothetical protein n=1 Tax=Leifsonia sp. A12D58 TaxID=3397674 RepID=UPI0039E03F61